MTYRGRPWWRTVVRICPSCGCNRVVWLAAILGGCRYCDPVRRGDLE